MRGGFAKEYAQLHRLERRNEEQQFPKTQYAQQGNMSAAPMAASKAYNQLAASAAGAGRNISGVVREGDAITGQIKNVLGMAFGYQAIQAVASQLQQVFGHLKGGVMQFNSMLEQATVGFTTLFKNQAQQAAATNEILGEQKVGIDYLTMGYKSAEEAAVGTIETIRQFANVTPFRFAEIQESTIRMRAFGFDMSEILRENSEATDKFSGGIVAVGNAVAALGGGADAFRRITYALGQMKQAGRVYQNDMMQLANAGIGGYKYIAEALMKEITTDQSGQRDKVIAGQERLYQELQSNAIETVRRLTTRGQISGEVASRAILSGLERDFGGGMIAQSKTFAGAFSTVADMSQSLVADAFRPLYEVIRDVTYEFSLFLQDPKVLETAKDFGRFIRGLLTDLKPLGALLQSIAGRVQKDFTGIISRFTAQSGDLQKSLGGTFGAFIIGIREIIKLLDNDYARSVIAAGVLAKLAFSFATTNPFLTSLGLAVSAIGALKFAINENLFGVGSAFDTIVARLEPLIGKLRDELLPVLTRVGETILSGLIAGLSAAIVAMEPALIAITDALTGIADVLVAMEGPLRVIGFLIGASLASKLILGAINMLSVAMLKVATNLNTVTAAANTAHTSMSKLAALGNIGLGIGIAGTMATQAAESAGAISPETAQALQAVFSIINAIAMLALVMKPVLTLFGSIAKAFGSIGKILGPIVSIVIRVTVALGGLVAGILGVGTGVGIAIVAIAGLIAAIAGFFLLQPPKPDDEKPDPNDRYDYRKGTVLENSGFYKDTYQERALIDFRKGERESQFP
jgi:tape measure domain-containing protein